MDGKKIYITTAIDYVNAKPHVGHAVEKVQTDSIARWYREVLGDDTFFMTGTDEMSLKNVQAAKKAGLPVDKFVDQNVVYFEKLKDGLDLSYNYFIRTTEEKHQKGAQKFWSMIKPEDIYKKNYKGLYCVGCEEFKLDKDLVDGKCPDHGTEPEVVEEENYFFKLSEYSSQLISLIESGKLEIFPEFRKNEVLSFIRGGLEDFSISRSKERAENWGVPVPGDESQVMYVWVDALSNYITGLDFATDGELYEKYWKNSDQRIHVIGKGILRFHAIYWPAMLLSAGLPLPTKIICHEYLTINGQKMSKTLGNVIDPEDIVKKYGVDATRYLLLSSLPSTSDGDISWDKMDEKYTADLANTLGNLVQRVLSMMNKYEVRPDLRQNYYDVIEEVEASSSFNAKMIEDMLMPEGKIDLALQEVWKLIRQANVFIEEKKPWALAKDENHAELNRVLNVCYWQIDKIADLLLPFMPGTNLKIKKQLETMQPEALFPRLNDGK